MYSEIVMDHFKNPRNVGKIEDPDGIGEVGNPMCRDMMTITIKVKNDRIEDIKFQTFRCGAAIAVSSGVTEAAKGKTLEEAFQITNQSVVEQLGGLPRNKLHCSNLGADALHQAIMDYDSKKQLRVDGKRVGREEAREKEEKHCYFPTVRPGYLKQLLFAWVVDEPCPGLLTYTNALNKLSTLGSCEPWLCRFTASAVTLFRFAGGESFAPSSL